MIKINVFNQSDYLRLLIQRAADTFFAEREHKSFSDRHPELGRMITCAVCGNRHRSSRTCTAVYARVAGLLKPDGSVDLVTKRQVHGAAAFKGKRILRHRNAWGLQVLERATLIYRDLIADPYWPRTNTEELGKHALSRALNAKRRERALRRKKLNSISYRSRQKNRVL